MEVALWNLILRGGIGVIVVVAAGTSDAAHFRISNVAEAKIFVAALTVRLKTGDWQFGPALLKLAEDVAEWFRWPVAGPLNERA